MAETSTSPSGGFAQRRVAKMQAREAKAHTNVAINASIALLSTTAASGPSLSAAGDLIAITTNANIDANSYTNGNEYANCRLQSGATITSTQCLLLAGLFLSTLSCVWAVPRHMDGRHLILPHHHHVHHRSADILNNLNPILTKVPPAQKTNQHCLKLNMSIQPTRKSIQDALNVTEQTRSSIQFLLEAWLIRDHDLSPKTAHQRYCLHRLELEHPLREAVKSVRIHFNDDDESLQFKFHATEIDAPAVELSKILDSLEIVRDVINSLKMPKELWAETFTHISEKMLHNVFMASAAMGIEKCDRSGYTYNNNHANVIYAIGMEAIKLLTVVQSKYELMLKTDGLLLENE